ncbi:MAG TPA: GDSL-type esterase/lipase family protein [Reyranella sp.]|nr:GDSL-type esterase/lipase family protein [Reyranella sp.]
MLVAGSVLFCLFVGEIGARLDRGPEWLFKFPNLVRYERVAIRHYSGAKAQYDPLLGFVGIPNYARPDFHYDDKSFRVTPAPAGLTLKEPPILAVGGSVTLGDEVADNETYPAQLQPLIGRRVINAGMDGYGLDQMVLRAEVVAKQEKPEAIVLGFGADNLRRSEMSRVWGVEKPYFERVGGGLVLRNVPVPPSPDPATTLDIWQRLFGRSVLLDLVLRRLKLQYEWALDHVRVRRSGEGASDSCLLFMRLAALKLPTIVVAEYDPYLWTDPPYMREQKALTAEVLRCAGQAGFATIDPFDEIDKTMRTAGRDALFRVGEHPNPAGQALTARLVAQKLRELGLQ